MKQQMYIIGHGFVGKAVSYAFNDDLVEKHIIDPKLGTSILDLKDKYPHPHDVYFVCVPTPMSDTGEINASILCDTVEYLRQNTEGLIIIKSTVTPGIIEHLGRGPEGKRVVYNPEFLREATAVADIITPSMHIFGGNPEYTEKAEKFFTDYSLCKSAPAYHMSLADASFVKYGINTFLASKVLWFNQFYDVIQKNGGNFGQIARAIATDERIGPSHMMVPGPDGKRGFGGACFPKDTAAFLNFAEEFSVLREVIERNNEYRQGYEKDDREKEQNISY